MRLPRAGRPGLQIGYSLSAILLLLNLISFALPVLSVSFDVVRWINGAFQVLLNDDLLLLILSRPLFTPKLVDDLLLLFLDHACRGRHFYRYISVQIQNILGVNPWGVHILRWFGYVLTAED